MRGRNMNDKIQSAMGSRHRAVRIGGHKVFRIVSICHWDMHLEAPWGQRTLPGRWSALNSEPAQKIHNHFSALKHRLPQRAELCTVYFFFAVEKSFVLQLWLQLWFHLWLQLWFYLWLQLGSCLQYVGLFHQDCTH
ncbi:hypothetical protein M758_7G087900 [Ceratodon purpureus]|nr:hypothetical protein M758_7G087900 [Ceratodon purpureus]